MKRTKRIFAIFMTLALAMSMLIVSSAVSFAANNEFEITLPSATGLVKDGGSVTYDIYQIFTGVYSEADNAKSLSDVHWGSSTAKSGNAATDAEVNAVAGLANGDAETARTLFTTYCTGSAFKTAQAAGAKVKVPGGYYLIKENITNPADGVEQSLYVVQVAGDVNITRKASTTSSDKKLDDKNDSDPSDAATNAEMDTSSDYDIGDMVPYHLKATVSEKVEQYKKYHVTFEDTLEAGKFDEISALTIKVDGKAIADTDDYTVTQTYIKAADQTGFKLKIEFTPKEGKTLASLNGKDITIDFSAKLGTGAAIGEAGNRNTLVVKYSNNPNSTDGSDEGTTPEKTVITFTYKVVVDKFDEDGKTPLEGAGFTLYKVSKADAEAGVTGADAAAKNAAWAAKKLTDSKGEWTTTASAGATAGKNNRFSFDGIDDGYYVLCETTTPAGYNTMEPQVFKVEATHGGTDGLTLTNLNGTKVDGNITFTSNVSAGSLTASVTNEKGATLPETGGIGTIIFYVLGSLLVVGCGIVLISKRRMESR